VGKEKWLPDKQPTTDADPGVITSRAIELFTVYQHNGQLALLNEAITLFRAATTAPPGHPDQAGFLSNLGTALRALFERTGNTGALEEAVGDFHPDDARSRP
jgi:hypothetical protein